MRLVLVFIWVGILSFNFVPGNVEARPRLRASDYIGNEACSRLLKAFNDNSKRELSPETRPAKDNSDLKTIHEAFTFLNQNPSLYEAHLTSSKTLEAYKARVEETGKLVNDLDFRLSAYKDSIQVLMGISRNMDNVLGALGSARPRRDQKSPLQFALEKLGASMKGFEDTLTNIYATVTPAQDSHGVLLAARNLETNLKLLKQLVSGSAEVKEASELSENDKLEMLAALSVNFKDSVDQLTNALRKKHSSAHAEYLEAKKENAQAIFNLSQEGQRIIEDSLKQYLGRERRYNKWEAAQLKEAAEKLEAKQNAEANRKAMIGMELRLLNDLTLKVEKGYSKMRDTTLIDELKALVQSNPPVERINAKYIPEIQKLARYALEHDTPEDAAKAIALWMRNIKAEEAKDELKPLIRHILSAIHPRARAWDRYLLKLNEADRASLAIQINVNLKGPERAATSHDQRLLRGFYRAGDRVKTKTDPEKIYAVWVQNRFPGLDQKIESGQIESAYQTMKPGPTLLRRTRNLLLRSGFLTAAGAAAVYGLSYPAGMIYSPIANARGELNREVMPVWDQYGQPNWTQYGVPALNWTKENAASAWQFTSQKVREGVEAVRDSMDEGSGSKDPSPKSDNFDFDRRYP